MMYTINFCYVTYSEIKNRTGSQQIWFIKLNMIKTENLSDTAIIAKDAQKCPQKINHWNLKTLY